MSGPTIHGNRPVFSASAVLEAIANDLLLIKSLDRLTYADIGAILGKSEDQAAKYCDGSAAMDAVTFARGKREWNGRFTGSYDRLCHDSRPCFDSDRERESKVLKAALALSVALADGSLSDAEIRQNRETIENARDALDGLLNRLTPKVVA